MGVTATVSPKDMLLPDNITDISKTMIGINATTDGMPTMMNNYTTTTEPQTSTAFVVFYYVLRFLFAGFAIFGNTLTIIAVFRFKKLQNNTNSLICSLAVADLIGCITVPLYLAHEMLLDEPIFVSLCLIDKTMLTISVLMNLSSILGITIDRYFFIVHGLHYPIWVTSTKIYTIIGITWSFVITEITTIFVSSHHLAIGVTCKFSIFLSKPVYWIIFIPQMGILMVLTIAFYVAIAMIALKQGKAIAALNQPYDTYEATLNKQQKKIAKMIGTVLGAYFACFIPEVLCTTIQGSSRTSLWLHYEKGAALIYWVNIWLNPLIYTWMSEDFGVAFRNLLGLKPTNSVYPFN